MSGWIPVCGNGSWREYTANAKLRIMLGPGQNNRIKLVGDSGGINVDYIAITPVN